jgi:hypothetical protein
MRLLAVAVCVVLAACEDPLPMDTRFGEPAQLASNYDGGWEPHVAMSSSGVALVMWQGMDGSDPSMWSNRYRPDFGWTVPDVIENNTGLAQAPALAIDGSGAGMAAWMQDVGAIPTIWTNRSFVDSASWDGASARTTTTADAPSIAANTSGFVILAWRATDGVFATRFDPATGWSSPELVGASGGKPLVAIDDAGNALVAWDTVVYQPEHISRVWANRYAVGGGWETPTMLVSNDADAVVTSLAMNRAGDAVVMTYEFTQLIGNSVFATFFDRATGWQAHTLVQQRLADVATAAIDDEGNVLAAWRVMDGVRPEVQAAYRPHGGGWGEAVVIGAAQDEAGRGEEERVSLAFHADGRAHAAWAQANGAWVNRFTPAIGWDDARVLRAGETTLPLLGVDGADRTMAVWAEDQDIFAAIELP